MPQQASFGISIALALIAWGIAVALYVWPQLRKLRPDDALRPILVLHTFRFVGLAFIVPGVVSADLPAAFARSAAYGDLTAAVLAILALVALRTKIASALLWTFNVWGTADLLYAFYEGNQTGLQAGQLGAAFFLVTVVVPLLLITHVLAFRLLLQGVPVVRQTSPATR